MLLTIAANFSFSDINPMPGWDGIRTRYRSSGQNGWNVQITFTRAGRADADAFIGKADMHSALIGCRVDSDSPDAHFAAGAHYAKSDFAAVGNEDFFKHGLTLCHYHQEVSPNSTGLPSRMRISFTTPPVVALMGFITFIASIISNVSPGLTVSPT